MEEERNWDDERGWIIPGRLLSSAMPCASRCGFVLFSVKMRKIVNSTLHHVCQYYVYNPFLKHDHNISLPTLELMPPHGYHLGDIATFTSDPTSPDCLFVVPTKSHTEALEEYEYYFISTYSIGEKTWKTHVDFPVHAMAYMGGSVYCFYLVYGLSSFYIATQKWRLLSNKPASSWWVVRTAP